MYIKMAQQQQIKMTIKESQVTFNQLLNNLLEKITAETNEGAMLECAKDMKNINKEFNDICSLAVQIRQNKYYSHHIAPRQKKDKKAINMTEEEKMKSGQYLLCSCGRYI